MATATITGLTNITNAESTTGWSDIGGGPGAAATTDVFIQGNGAVGRRAATGGRGFYFTAGAGIDFTVPGRYLWMWINVPLGPGGLDSIANGGLSILAGTGATNYNLYYVGGGDVTAAGWKRYIIDLNLPFSAQNGAGATLNNIDTFGIFTNWLTVPGGNIPHYVIDSIDYGGVVNITGGTSGDRLTWDDIYIYSDGTPTTRVLGAVQKQGGVYFVNGGLTLGGPTGDCYFEDSNQVVVFQNQSYHNGTSVVPSLPPGSQALKIEEGTGTTNITDGIIVGSGDTASGRSGSLIRNESGALSTVLVDCSNVNTSTLNFYGTTFIEIGANVIFTDDATNGPNHNLLGVTFNNTAQVIAGNVNIRDTTFSGYQPEDGAALLWNDQIDIKFSSFLGNSNDTGNSHAIEHRTSGSFDYDNLSFSGNDADIKFTSPTGNLVINSIDSNPSTSNVVGGVGTVTINNAVTLAFKVQNSASANVANARVYLIADEGGPLTANTLIINSLTDAAGEFSTSFNYSTDQPVIGRIRKSTESPFYRTFPIVGTITDVGFTVNAIMISDE